MNAGPMGKYAVKDSLKGDMFIPEDEGLILDIEASCNEQLEKIKQRDPAGGIYVCEMGKECEIDK